jgi:type III secretion system FlhB-like substrate exporter
LANAKRWHVGIVTRERLVALLEQTSVNKEVRERILADVARDFGA